MTDTGKKLGLLERIARRIPPDFGQVNPASHYWVFTPLVIAQMAWVIYRGNVSAPLAALLLAGGAFYWTFLEYILHRFSFHSTSEHPLLRPFNSGLHLLHHNDPSNKLYVAAPLVTAPPVYLTTLALFWLVSRTLDNAIVMGSGFLAMFLFYEFTHYSAHHRNPTTRAMRYLKKHHMLHHFADKDNRFGVTSPIWDFAFGTLQAVNRRPGAARKRDTASPAS